jgi:hypothetical protein
VFRLKELKSSEVNVLASAPTEVGRRNIRKKRRAIKG